MIKKIPLDRMVLETNSPNCLIKSQHAAYDMISTRFNVVNRRHYKGETMVINRNEPCTLIQVLEVVASIRGIDKYELAEIVWANSHKVLNLKDDYKVTSIQDVLDEYFAENKLPDDYEEVINRKIDWGNLDQYDYLDPKPIKKKKDKNKEIDFDYSQEALDYYKNVVQNMNQTGKNINETIEALINEADIRLQEAIDNSE